MRLSTGTLLLLSAAASISALAVAGCAGFWSPLTSNASFSLSNSANISVAPGAAGTSTITVTPANSFTGTVALTCAIASGPTGATSPATCGLSPTSLTFSSTTAQTSVLTVSTTSTTTTGEYAITVTGTSGSVSQTASVCAQVSTSSSACTTAGASGVFYVLNQTTNQIAVLSITASGALNSIATTTVTTPLAIAVAPNGKFLYVSNPTGIYLYTIASNGALTIANGGVTISSDPATTMQVDATNSWLVDAISGSTQLAAINVNASTGALLSTTEQYFSGGLPTSSITQLAISPNDSSSCASCYVFVGMDTGGFETIHFNPANANPFGAFGHTAPISAGGDKAVAVDPSNRLLYVGESDALPSATQSGGLRVFTIASGSISELAGSPYNIGATSPSAIQPSSDGNYVYVASRSVSGSANGNIASFSVTSSALAFIATLGAGPSGAFALAQDSSHNYLLAVDGAGNPDLEAYTMTSGALTSILSHNTGTDPVGAAAIAAAP